MLTYNERTYERAVLKIQFGFEMSLATNWERIAAWYEKNADGEFWLTRGASETELVRLEQALDVELPKSFRESYQLHDGSATNFLLHHGELLSLSDIPSCSRKWQDAYEARLEFGNSEPRESDISPEIRPVYWSALRVPVTDDGGGNSVCVDLDPADSGTVGQVVYAAHDDGPIRVLAPDFESWVAQMADDLESGKYVYTPGSGVAPKGMWD